MSRSQPEAEGLTLLVADNKTGYFGVTHLPGRPKPYKAQVRRGGTTVHLGSFVTAEEAALCIAWSPEGQEAVKRPAAPPPLTSEETRQQAEAEGLTLLKADNKAGYFGVSLTHPGQPKPYDARVRRGGKLVHLGYFATAEEAALCVARTPEGQEAAKQAAAAPPLTSEEAQQQAQAEGLTLLKADNKAGYFGVSLCSPGCPKPYEARVWHGGKKVSLGMFATAEEAALCIARSPEGQETAAKQAAAAPPLTSEEARQQARAEGLTLLKADNAAGYYGVCLTHPGYPKPYKAHVRRGGKTVHLGHFATAEEAALCIARSPEGRAAAKRAAASEGGQGTGRAMPPGAVLKEEGAVPPMPPDAFVKEEQVVPPMPPGAFFKEESVVPPMPPDAIVKREHAVVVKEEEPSEESSHGRVKRRRSK